MKELIASGLATRIFNSPIFMVGASRSGTIVLYKALGQHRQILSMPSENPFVTHVADAAWPFLFGEETDYFNEAVRLSRQELFDRLRKLLFESTAGADMGAKTLAKAMLEHGSGFLGKRFWCVKCFPLERHANALVALYPDSRFIYIVRNGIDVVQSRTKFPAFSENSFESHCEFWKQAAKKFEYLTRWDRAVAVRQEELLSDPKDMFSRIFAHLELEHDARPIEYVTSTLVHSRGDKATHENIDVRKSLTERPPSYSTWDSDQRATFKRVCADTMDALGYDIPF